MFDGITPLSKRCSPRELPSRVRGEVFVDDSKHNSIGPCHLRQILLFDIDFRCLCIRVAHRHREVGHGYPLVVGQRGPGMSRHIGAERLAHTSLLRHLPQLAVVAGQGGTIEAHGLLAFGITRHKGKEAVAIHSPPSLENSPHTGLQMDAYPRSRLLSTIRQITSLNGVLAQHSNIYEGHAHRIETKQEDVLGELSLPVASHIKGAHAPDLGHRERTLRGRGVAREDLGEEIHATSASSHPVVEGAQGAQIAGTSVDAHASLGQPAVIAHHNLARQGRLIYALDGEKALQRAQGRLIIRVC